MSRGVGVVAWIVATILSVVASTAAVATVRAQVTDEPEVVSLATLRRAAASTTTLPVPPPSPPQTRPAATTTTSTTPPTTRPSPVLTPGTTVEVIAPPATEESDEVDSQPDPNVITRTLRGGTVSIGFDGSDIWLIDAVPEDSYEVSIEEQGTRRIVVRFVLEGRSTAFAAEVANGELRIAIFD